MLLVIPVSGRELWIIASLGLGKLRIRLRLKLILVITLPFETLNGGFNIHSIVSSASKNGFSANTRVYNAIPMVQQSSSGPLYLLPSNTSGLQ